MASIEELRAEYIKAARALVRVREQTGSSVETSSRWHRRQADDWRHGAQQQYDHARAALAEAGEEWDTHRGGFIPLQP